MDGCSIYYGTKIVYYKMIHWGPFVTIVCVVKDVVSNEVDVSDV